MLTLIFDTFARGLGWKKADRKELHRRITKTHADLLINIPKYPGSFFFYSDNCCQVDALAPPVGEKWSCDRGERLPRAGERLVCFTVSPLFWVNAAMWKKRDVYCLALITKRMPHIGGLGRPRSTGVNERVVLTFPTKAFPTYLLN